MEPAYDNNFRSDDDLSAFVINIHAMKSALANIGETDLSAEAAALEHVGREKDTNLILSGFPPFLEKLRAVIKKLEPGENAGNNANAAGGSDVGDNKYLEEKLLAVKEACALLNKKTAKDTLAELRKKTWLQPVDEQLSAISVHLLHSEFDEAIQVIDDCLWQL